MYCAKPSSSRHSSVEAFVVARDYRPAAGFDAARFSQRLLGGSDGGLGLGHGHGAAARGEEERRTVPFVACGDLGGYDHEEEEGTGLDVGLGG